MQSLGLQFQGHSEHFTLAYKLLILGKLHYPNFILKCIKFIRSNNCLRLLVSSATILSHSLPPSALNTSSYTHIQICIHTLLLLISLARPIHHRATASAPPPQPFSCCVISCSSQWKQPHSNNSRLPRRTTAPTAATAASNKHTAVKTPWWESCGFWFHSETLIPTRIWTHTLYTWLWVFLVPLRAFSWTHSLPNPLVSLWALTHFLDLTDQRF